MIDEKKNVFSDILLSIFFTHFYREVVFDLCILFQEREREKKKLLVT